MQWASRAALAGAVLAATAACSDSTGPAGFQSVTLNFRVNGSAGAAPSPSRVSGPSRVAGPPLAIQGSNGTLTIEEIRVIVAEVELEAVDGSCDVPSPSDDDCPDFESPPRFLDLPLDGRALSAVTGLVPEGRYKELEFEIEDLEDDEEDPAERAAIAALRAQILTQFPDWPRKASALVVGTFTPTGGSAERFRVYLEAEVEVELELMPPLVVTADGPSRELTVDVVPEIWFLRPDGRVMDLRQFDYDRTGQLLEFELEMENGFTEIEFD